MRWLIAVTGVLWVAGFVTPGVSAESGTLEVVEIHSPALEENLIGDPATREMCIYLPPSYASGRLRYPVILVLHGFGQDFKWGAGTTLYDELMLSGQMPESIIVCVDGNNRFGGSNYRSSETIGDYETYITRDILAFVDANYRTIPHRDSRGIYGYSMGGTGSLHLALSYPEVLGAVVGAAGGYDFGYEPLRRTMVNSIPSAMAADWDSYSSLEFSIGGGMAQDFLACAAGTIPNPDQPPFFVDVPFVEVDGQIQEAFPGAWDQAWDRVVEHDVMHDLDRYIAGAERLRFIGFIHGRNDIGWGGWSDVEQARILDRRLTELGIEHTYVEHDGGHESRIGEALVLLSAHLRAVPPGMPAFASVAPERMAAIAGQSRLLDVHVTLEASLETGDETARLVLDASALGGPSAIPLARGDDAEYAGRATVTSARSGQFPLRIVLETGLGDAYAAPVLPVDVFPDGPAVILDERLAPDWSVTAGGGAQPPVFDASVTPARGDVAAAFAVESASFVGWNVQLIPDEPVHPLGYAALAFSFHPGDATGSSLVVGTGSSQSVVLVGRRAGDIKVDLERREWQEVMIPLELLLDPYKDIPVVRLSGSLEGTFHLDDLRLVAVDPPAEATAVTEQRGSAVPGRFALAQNYPNPFNSGTVIRFTLPQSQDAELALFNLAGQRVATLVQGRRDAGTYTVRWDGTDDAGHTLASGVYLYRLQTGNGKQVETRKLLLLR
jgi:enterochelin esterase-like enzyme